VPLRQRQEIQKMLRKIAPFFLSLLTGALLASAFPLFDLSALAWCALIPLFHIIYKSSPKASFFFSFLAGILFFAADLYWLVYVTIAGYITLAFYMGLYIGLFGLLANRFLRKARFSGLDFLSCLVLPALWAALEFARGALFTGFPWGILGYTQYNRPLFIQIADITGPYGVSFMIVMVNFVVYSHMRAFFAERGPLRFQKTALSAVLIGVLLYGFASLAKEESGPVFRVSVIQGNIEQAQKWDPYYGDYIWRTYGDLTLEAAAGGGDLILWPETSVPGFLGDNDAAARMSAIAEKAAIPVLAGIVRLEDGRLFNSAVLFEPDGRIKQKYDKIHLVPFGEYVPFERHFPFIRDFIDVEIGDYSAGREFTLFHIDTKGGAGFKCAALICFEDIFPDLLRQFVLRGAEVAVNITNDAWFRESSEQLQHAQASVFRAVENRIGIVRAANTGFSCYISPKGVIEDYLGDKETGSMYVSGFKTFAVRPGVKEGHTFYSRFGDAFAYLCVFVSLIACALPR